MCQLLETIMVKEGRLQNLHFHNLRVNKSRRALFQINDSWDLSEMIIIPELDKSGIYRCRFLYSLTVEKTEFLSYTPRQIQKLRIVEADDLNYAFKFADRAGLESIKNKVAPGANEDILIIKNGHVTDTSFSNIVFYDGQSWVTPHLPLLKGTKRDYYLSLGMIREMKITPADLPAFKKARLINAMLDLETVADIEIRNIIR